MKNNRQSLFLNNKSYLLSFFVAFSSLVLITCVFNIFGVIYPLNGIMLLSLALSVAISCALMSITDRLPLKSNFLIGLVDIMDICITVFSLNLIASIIENEWFDFSPVMIILILSTIILTYASTCIVFFISDFKNEKQINAKIKMMKHKIDNTERNEDI